MNPEEFSRDNLLKELHPLILGGVLLLVILLGGLSWLARNKFPATRWYMRIFGALFTATAFFTLFQLATKWLVLETSWSLVLIALLAGIIWEVILFLYSFEKTLVTPLRGRSILLLRLLALTTLILILAQPVYSYFKDRPIDREIAVLFDDSQSMHLVDERLSISEKLDRAEAFGSEAVLQKRPNIRQISQQLNRLTNNIKQDPNPVADQYQNKLIEVQWLINAAIEKSISDNHKQTLATILDQCDFAKAKPDLVAELDLAHQTIEALTDLVDEDLYKSLSQAETDQIDQFALAPRSKLANQSTAPLLQKLADKYTLQYYRFNREIEAITSTDSAPKVDPNKATSIRAQTDLTGALEHILNNSSPEVLAGILLLSDGRNTSTNLPTDSLRQMAVQGAPLCSIPFGGKIGPVDAAILSLSAPESIYLDDRVVITAQTKFDGLRGKDLKAQLIHNNEVVNEVSIAVTDVKFQNELRFTHTPTTKGIIDYQVKIEVDERELFADNNSWKFKVAVTDDRTNVLLVDGYPRWEFRYLRNLFYGRDKSVHLQYTLLNPDTISGLNNPPAIPADATRKFGDAQATELPATPDDWKLFDIIILGDVKPNQLGSRDWQAIEEAVTKRGALLVCVAGPRHMPHGFNNQTLKRLLPVTYSESSGDSFSSPEPQYKIALTNSGRAHPLMAQSASRELNAELWSSFPPLRWRWASQSVKQGAEVLAYARTSTTKESVINTNPDSIESALQQLTQKKQQEQDNALITTMRSGLGKVVLMNFDRTWRFRYGVGDTYHHRFWGQLARWGAGPNLRSGVETLRLGTDRLTYTPSDEIIVTAKVLDNNRKPIINSKVFANVIKNGKSIARQPLAYRNESPGFYDTTFPALTEAGEYRIELEGTEVDQAIADDASVDNIGTELLVITTRNPVELAELTADRNFLQRAAHQTNGVMAELWQLDQLNDAFGAPKQTLTERQTENLWDTTPFLCAFLAFLTLEWILRRTGGLV